MKKDWIQTPIGVICLISENDNPKSLYFAPKGQEYELTKESNLSLIGKQVLTYFTDKNQDFKIEYNKLEGTDFQKEVWKIVAEIPFGKTLSYGAIAQKMGDKKLSRAVGMANGKNPIAIIIPCHRVIGSNGDLTGYAWGVKRKQWLIEFEQSIRQATLF